MSTLYSIAATRTGATSTVSGPTGSRIGWASTLCDAFRRVRRNTKGSPSERHVVNLSKKVFDKGTVKVFEHVALLLNDAIDRGAPQVDAEAFGHAILALVRSRYPKPSLPLRDLARAETNAQCVADPAEWDLHDDADLKTIADAEMACSVHLIQLERLVDALRKRLYTSASR